MGKGETELAQVWMWALKIRRKVCFPGSSLLAMATFAHPCAGAEKTSETAFYTNSCYEKESGDVAGYVVKEQGGGPHPDLWIYWSEGVFMEPAPAKIVNDARAPGRFAFVASLPGGSRRLSFDGVKTDRALEGMMTSPWDTTPRHVVLERRPEKEAFDPQRHVGTGYCAPLTSSPSSEAQHP